MRPYNGYYEECDDSEDFVYGRSQALSKLLDGHRREERHKNCYRKAEKDKAEKDRHRRDTWSWDSDGQPYVDGTCSHYSENMNGNSRAY